MKQRKFISIVNQTRVRIAGKGTATTGIKALRVARSQTTPSLDARLPQSFQKKKEEDEKEGKRRRTKEDERRAVAEKRSQKKCLVD